jgi:ribosomal protein S18 acetylase RimI-like enzyme
MVDDRLDIRTATRAELDLLVDWAAAEGWNPGLADADAFYAADPYGFFLGRLDGEPVGGISGVAYGDGFGFLGFYIVRPDYRGRGFGLRLWHACMDYLGTRLVGLDGVVAQQANYRKSGFRLAWNNVRYAGVGGAAGPPGNADIGDAATLPFDAIAACDRACFPAARERFLRAWLALPGSTALALRRDGALAGYGVVRRCRSGHKIGPLFADDGAAAEALFSALAGRAAGGPVLLDIAEPNAAARALVARHGMRPVFETARMYTGPAPDIALDRVFGITTFELG